MVKEPLPDANPTLHPDDKKGFIARKRRSFKLSKALFILPNAFTLSSIFCGVYAILHSITNTGPEALYQSAIAIFFAGFFDMFDGRVARLTKTQSEFGVQLDSLADVVSFGVATSILVFKWALWPLGFLGIFGAFFFTACGAIRLARFNVLAARAKEGSSKYFVGLPIPLAASMLIALVIAHYKLFGGLAVERHMSVFVLVLVLGLLMVSNVSYWTFKEFHFNVKSATIVFAAALAVWLIGLHYPVSVSLVALLGAYIVAGLARAGWRVIRRQS
jgi:CDP-diacylglycerol--serine O-phosphatidyltransferase